MKFLSTEMMAVVATLTDVKQLLVESHAVSRLTAAIPDLTPTHLGKTHQG